MAKSKNSNKPNSLRIIAGRWRGRTIEFADSPGLRPSGDRVRETLFNWLQVQIPESRCLDLFAGSGALGFEALSRGASEVVMVERAGNVTASLRAAAKKLDAGSGLRLKPQSALDFIVENKLQFDIVFLDPPFESDLHKLSIDALKNASWLAEGTMLYVECPKNFKIKDLLPPDWTVLKEKSAGQVLFLLLRV